VARLAGDTEILARDLLLRYVVPHIQVRQLAQVFGDGK
jgi:hypothetical protein